MLSIQLIDVGFGGVNLSLKRWLFELIKEIVFFDFRAFNKHPLFKKRCNARNESDPPHCLDPANEFIGLRYLLLRGPDHTYGGGTCRLLCGDTACKAADIHHQDKNRRKSMSHSLLQLLENSSLCS
jgi:hypothetical protein